VADPWGSKDDLKKKRSGGVDVRRTVLLTIFTEAVGTGPTAPMGVGPREALGGNPAVGAGPVVPLWVPDPLWVSSKVLWGSCVRSRAVTGLASFGIGVAAKI
jgi:hypothetical protein